MVGILLLASSGVFGFRAIDRWVAESVAGWRLQLEGSLARPLGHSIRVGPYQGLRLWGLSFGRSQILPSKLNRSQINLDSFVVSLDPLASLRKWKPVLRFNIRGLEAKLRRNKEGNYWTLGQSDSTDNIPDLELHYRLDQPARLIFEPAGRELELSGHGAIQLAKSSFNTTSSLRWLGQTGSLRLEGSGRWDRPQFSLRGRANALELKTLAALLPATPSVVAAGTVNGDLHLQWSGQTMGCQGRLNFTGVRLQLQALSDQLRFSRTRIDCHDGQILLAPVRIYNGNLTAAASGTIAPGKRVDLKFTVHRYSDFGENALHLQIIGPWAEAHWQLTGQLGLQNKSALRGPFIFKGKGTTSFSRSNGRRILLKDLSLQAPGLRLALSGQWGQATDLRSTKLLVLPELWKDIPILQASLGTAAPVLGQLVINGEGGSPVVHIKLAQADNPLLDNWTLRAQWSKNKSALILNQFNSPFFKATAYLPVTWAKSEVRSGELRASLRLQSLELQRFSVLAGIKLGGTLSASGRLQGPLNALQSNLTLATNQPRIGPILLSGLWTGRLSEEVGQRPRLLMTAAKPTVPGVLDINFATNGWPLVVELERGGGLLRVVGSQNGYNWTATGLALNGLKVVFPFYRRPVPVTGKVTGTGQLNRAPIGINGNLAFNALKAGPLILQQASLNGNIQDDHFQAKAILTPPLGTVTVTTQGTIGKPLYSRLEATDISFNWLLNLTRQLLNPKQADKERLSHTDDLGTIITNTFGNSLDSHLQILAKTRQTLKTSKHSHPDQEIRINRLDGRLNALATLQGPYSKALIANIQAQAHLWINNGDQAKALQLEPVMITLQGSLFGGNGKFSLLHLPISLMALFIPVPPVLQGTLGLHGRYDLSDTSPLIHSSLVLKSTILSNQQPYLKRNAVILKNGILHLDLALQSRENDKLITLQGSVPLDPSSNISLQIESHRGTLHMLAGLTRGDVKIHAGKADLSLILRGSLSQPIANGFMVISNGNITVGEQNLSRVNASILFDSNQIELQWLEAQLGSSGKLQGAGSIGLFQRQKVDSPLTFEITKGTIHQSIIRFQADGKLVVKGALTQPSVAGNLTFSNGVITPRSGILSRTRNSGLSNVATSNARPNLKEDFIPKMSVGKLWGETWDFKKPLVLIEPNTPLQESQDRFRQMKPNLPTLRFRNLKLVLGPNLEVEMPPWISFRVGGELLLNGPLDSSLQTRGVIRLNSGRVTLFTTTFLLDSKASNVAVFTPSLGLVPYIDVAMKARVSDSVGIGASDHVTNSNVFETNGLGMMSIGGSQLNLVKVTVEAVGKADRLRDNLKLRSAPPMGESELLRLIGGNSLNGLAGAGGAALATMVGQSLLSPVLGTITNVLGQRMQIGLLPTYVTPSVKPAKEGDPGQAPPTFTLVTEVGIDITDRFDLSLIAAPNNPNVPPQTTVTYRLTPSTTLSGSVDFKGTWQSQLQVLFRF
ncbi:translocation/assembly module TamB domain-containing protein [Synechococcus sp. M16CYN]